MRREWRDAFSGCPLRPVADRPILAASSCSFTPVMDHATGTMQHEALQRVLGVARLLGASADLDRVLQVIIDAVRDILEADRATVFLYDASNSELYTRVAHGLADEGEGDAGGAAGPGSAGERLREEPRGIRFPVTHGLAGEAARTRRIINVPDAYADPRFNREVDRQTGFRTRSILSIPLLAFDGELIGVTQVLNKRGRPFDEADEQIATALAAQAAVAIKRSKLIEDQLKRQKLERDLQLARQIQQQTNPRAIPVVAGFDLAAWNEPAEETGGDAYDIIGLSGSGDQIEIVDTRTASERAVLMIADATGHGIGPALMATSVRSMLRMAVRVGTKLEPIIRQLNHQVCQDVPSGRFVTCWVGMIDNRRSELKYFSAGQAPLLHFHAATGCADVIEADEMPFGIDDQWPDVNVNRRALAPGDLFLVISDGFFESIGPEGGQWGTERAIEVVRKHRDGSAEQITKALRAAVEQFTQGQPAADDRTIIVIKRTT
jgi:phosphoserine phosphatase